MQEGSIFLREVWINIDGCEGVPPFNARKLRVGGLFIWGLIDDKI